MPNKPTRGGAGGAANELGAEFRAAFVAWVASHALAGRAIEALDLPAVCDVPSGRLLLEGDAPVDDIDVGLSGDARMLVQAKHSVDVSPAADRDLAKTARQFARQARAPGFDPARTRLVLAVGTATGPLRALQRALARRRRPTAAQATAAEQAAISVFASHLADLPDADQRATLDASAVLLPDLVSAEAPSREAALAWLEAHIVEPGFGVPAWGALVRRAQHGAARRFGLDLDDWLDALARARVPLRADVAGPAGPRRQATRLALTRYRAALVGRGTRVSVRALAAAVPELRVAPNTANVRATLDGSEKGNDASLAWVIRRTRRLLLLGDPGIGKTTALRRLAAELATIEPTVAEPVVAEDVPREPSGCPVSEPSPTPIPLFVFVPHFADALYVGGNALETLVDVGVRDIPEADRTLVRAEVLAECRAHGRVLLLLDGLDECRVRRHALVAAVQRAVDELHDDAEVLVATRDVAFADAAALGFRSATLGPPRDLSGALQIIAAHLAGERSDWSPAERTRWVDAVVDAATRHAERDGAERTPLGAIGRVVLAARNGVEALEAGRAAVRSALVDWIAERWEIDERRRGELLVSAQLTAAESQQFVVHAFDVIAYALEADGTALADTVQGTVARWAQTVWGMPGPRAIAAAAAAVAFWDEAGVFVAGGPHAVVRARLATFQELGAARWLARQAEEPARAAWVRGRLEDSDREEVLALLGELHPGTAAEIVERARASGDRRTGLLGSRVLASHEAGGSARTSLVRAVYEALMPHLAVGGESGWQVLVALLPLPLEPTQASSVIALVRQCYAPARAALAEAVTALRWTPTDLDLTGAVAALTAGPPPPWPRPEGEQGNVARRNVRAILLHAVEPLYNQLAIQLAPYATDVQPALVDALLSARHLSMSAVERVHAALRRRGWAERVVQANRDLFAESALQTSALFSDDARVDGQVLGWVSALARPRATYGQRRHLDEIGAYHATVLPGDSPYDEILLGVRGYPELAREALRCACVLGGFDAGVLAAQAETLAVESGHHIWQLSLGATARAMAQWPDGGGTTGADLLARVIRLFGGSGWTADVAHRALTRHPDPLQVAAKLAAVVPTVRDYRARLLAAVTLLEVDPHATAHARRWAREVDPVLARVGSVVIAQWFAAGQIDTAALRDALSVRDDQTRDRVRAVLEERSLTPEAAKLVRESRLAPYGTWMCLSCGHVNPSSQRDGCLSCRLLH